MSVGQTDNADACTHTSHAQVAVLTAASCNCNTHLCGRSSSSSSSSSRSTLGAAAAYRWTARFDGAHVCVSVGSVCLCVCVSMYVCMYVRMYGCMCGCRCVQPAASSHTASSRATARSSSQKRQPNAAAKRHAKSAQEASSLAARRPEPVTSAALGQSSLQAFWGGVFKRSPAARLGERCTSKGDLRAGRPSLARHMPVGAAAAFKRCGSRCSRRRCRLCSPAVNSSIR